MTSLLKNILYFQTASSMISIISRDDWGAKTPKLVEKFDGIIPYVIIHHSYRPRACFLEDECKTANQEMQYYHQEGHGWNDIGYSFTIGGDGNIYQGRGFNVVGAHAPKYNTRSVGICLIGDWRYEIPPQNMLEATQKLLSYGVEMGLIDKNYTLYGHRQVRSTECPGDALYNEIQTWSHWREENTNDLS